MSLAPSVSVTGRIKGVRGRDVAAQAREVMDSYQRELKRLFVQEVKSILLSGSVAEVVISKTVEVLREMQGHYWEGDAKLISEDPTALARKEQIAAVRIEINKNFQMAAGLFNEGSMTLELVHLSDEFLGITGYSKTSTRPIVWLYFFLFGSLESDLMWVSAETYKAIFRKEVGTKLGRFGAGFLLHVSDEARPIFRSRLEEAGLLSKGESLDRFIHPQSGKKGHNYFKGILASVDFNALVIQPALAEARIKLQNQVISRG